MTSLDGLRALEQAATPAPWSTEDGWVDGPGGEQITHLAKPARDAAFVVAARNALPDLLGRVAAAEAERDALLFRAERADAKIAEALGWLRDYCEAEGRPYLVTEAISDLNWARDALAASVPSGPAAGGEA